MFKSKIKAKLAKNQTAHVVCLHLTDPTLHEMVGLMGFDGIWIDMEHHVFGLESAQDLMRAARIGSGADIFVRPARGEFMRLARMLEAGAHGIMYPRCADAEEAARVVKAMKYFPLGERGFDGGNRDMPFTSMGVAEYVQMANEQTFLFVQIETPEAVDQAHEIVSVEGVDGIFFGPADFSVLSGIPGQFDDPKVSKAIEKVADAAHRAGKHWAIPVGSVEKIKQYRDMGIGLIAYGGDLIMVKQGLEKIQQELSPLGFEFDNRMPDRESYLPSSK